MVGPLRAVVRKRNDDTGKISSPAAFSMYHLIGLNLTRGIVTLKAAKKINRGCRALLGRVVIQSSTRPRLPIETFLKYSGIPL